MRVPIKERVNRRPRTSVTVSIPLKYPSVQIEKPQKRDRTYRQMESILLVERLSLTFEVLSSKKGKLRDPYHELSLGVSLAPIYYTVIVPMFSLWRERVV